MTIRGLLATDLPGLAAVIGATGLFPPELLAGMTAPHLRGEAEEVWRIVPEVALAYAAPERMTEGCWNMLLIAVDPRRQRAGLGAALVRAVEAEVGARGGRLLLVETSGLPGFAGTRAFYACQGYAEEARIRDFYQAGEDKIVFCKLLTAPAR